MEQPNITDNLINAFSKILDHECETQFNEFVASIQELKINISPTLLPTLKLIFETGFNAGSVSTSNLLNNSYTAAMKIQSDIRNKKSDNTTVTE